MTDKVKSAIYIYDTIYKRASRITLQCLLTRINNRTLDTSGTLENSLQYEVKLPQRL